MTIRQTMKYLKHLFFSITLIGLICALGCVGPRSDPLKDWRMCRSQDPQKLDKAIQDDYQNYIQHLSSRQRKYVVNVDLFEDATRQHAVKIEIGLNGTWLEHLLIYDSQNRRVRTITYRHGHYAS